MAGRSARDNELHNAISALFDVLELKYLDGGYVRAMDGTIASQTTCVQVTAAAKRLRTSEPLGIFGPTAEKFLVAAGFG